MDERIKAVINADFFRKLTDYEEYEDYFRAAYEKINYFDFPEEGDIFQYSECGESLGEIRSLYMARKQGYIYFMSDDADARTLAKSFFSSKRTLEVKTLFDAFVMCRERNTKLKWKDINPTVTNAMRKSQKKILELKAMYMEKGGE